MNFSSLREILDFAIQREEEAAASYASMKAAAKNEALKKLLADLEQDEVMHKKLLLGLVHADISNLTVKKVTDLKISDYLVEEPVDAEMSFQDLLIFAAKKEQRAVDLYTQLRDKVTSAEHQKLFDLLIMQEKSHKLKLETEYEKHVLWED